VKLPFRLVAIDIDGTLLNSAFSISPIDLAAVKRAHELGVEVLLCTGRRHAFAMPIAAQLGFEIWMSSSNGAVTRSTRGEDFHRDLLPREVASKFLAHMKDFRSGTVVTFDKESAGALIVEQLDELAGTVARWVEKNREFIKVVSPIEDALNTDPLQAMVCGTIPRMQKAEAALAGFAELDRVTVLKTQYEDRNLCLLDILNRGCSKGHAVERWAKWRGIPRQEVMAIGDNYNDIEMLQFAGYPVIMGNSSADLKQHGWMETGSNDEHGIAQALEMVLGSELMQTEVR
jgi:Cof subfamily protein (haloacid dehalogenase superfamily)